MIGILTIGTELLIGKVINTNAANLARFLDKHGLSADVQLSTVDEPEAIIKGLTFMNDCQLILVTGGLGDTHDDISQKLFDEHFEHHDKTVIPNLIGTAPGYIYHGIGKNAILFPGPPIENQAMFEAITPFLSQTKPSRQYHITGYREYDLEKALIPHLPLEQFATYTDQGFTTVRILSQDYDNLIRDLFGPSLVGINDETIEQTIFHLCLKHGLRVATVESITSGEIASRLSSLPGSSQYFYGGLVVYQNDAKVQLAGMSEVFLDEHTSVSPETSHKLAEDFLASHPVDVVLAVTGYADHEDETLHGVSHLCCVTKQGMLEQTVKYPWIRSRIRSRVAFAGLDLIRRTLLKYYENTL